MSYSNKLKIINVVGARPNFVKIAPLMAQYKNIPEISPILVHTGQHYDKKMSDSFFEQLGIPMPDINLEVGSNSHAVQTADIMKKFEPVVLKHQPNMVLVVGDVNSTLACALVAAKMGIKVAHVEAGLRSFDRTMPEEINRILTDAVSDYLFVSEPSGVENLKREGIPDKKIFFVGNVMVDTLINHIEKADQSNILQQLGIKKRNYVLVTLHRPATTDNINVLRDILLVLKEISHDINVIMPMHPRTKRMIKDFNLLHFIEDLPGVLPIEPLEYIDFLRLMKDAKVVLTDSGGIQEETTILNIPCLTLRENTERPITLGIGTNTIVGVDPERILKGFKQAMNGAKLTSERPELWDGRAAERVVEVLLRKSTM